MNRIAIDPEPSVASPSSLASRPGRIWQVLAPVCLVLAGLLGAAQAAEGNRVLATFRETDTLFPNPGQGWMSQQRRPRGEPRFPCSVVYIRFNWADAEPEPGHFNWALIDDVIAAWKPQGAAVAMRVMTCNAHSGGYLNGSETTTTSNRATGRLTRRSISCSATMSL